MGRDTQEQRLEEYKMRKAVLAPRMLVDTELLFGAMCMVGGYTKTRSGAPITLREIHALAVRFMESNDAPGGDIFHDMMLACLLTWFMAEFDMEHGRSSKSPLDVLGRAIEIVRDVIRADCCFKHQMMSFGNKINAIAHPLSPDDAHAQYDAAIAPAQPAAAGSAATSATAAVVDSTPAGPASLAPPS